MAANPRYKEILKFNTQFPTSFLQQSIKILIVQFYILINFHRLFPLSFLLTFLCLIFMFNKKLLNLHKTWPVRLFKN